MQANLLRKCVLSSALFLSPTAAWAIFFTTNETVCYPQHAGSTCSFATDSPAESSDQLDQITIHRVWDEIAELNEDEDAWPTALVTYPSQQKFNALSLSLIRHSVQLSEGNRDRSPPSSLS